MIIRPSYTVLGGAAFGLVAAVAVYGAVSAASAAPTSTVKPAQVSVAASAPAPVSVAAGCAAGEELEHGVCIVHVEHLVRANPPATPSSTGSDTSSATSASGSGRGTHDRSGLSASSGHRSDDAGDAAEDNDGSGHSGRDDGAGDDRRSGSDDSRHDTGDDSRG